VSNVEWARLSSWDATGRRPCHGRVDRLQEDPTWKDYLVRNESFHGDNGGRSGPAGQATEDREKDNATVPPS
jgi:hypothetical protein